MYIITATWYDDLNEPFFWEHFSNELKPEDILDLYVNEKAERGKEVIASNLDLRVFSDGTRVMLTLHKVKQRIETDRPYQQGFIDAEAV